MTLCEWVSSDEVRWAFHYGLVFSVGSFSKDVINHLRAKEWLSAAFFAAWAAAFFYVSFYVVRP